MASYLKARRYTDKRGNVRTYYSVQVPVPTSKRAAVGKRSIVRYLGAKRPTSMELRGAVAEVEAEISQKAATHEIDDQIRAVDFFGPTDEQIAQARETLAAIGLDVVDTNAAERVTLSKLKREREGKVRDAVIGGPLTVGRAVLEYLDSKSSKEAPRRGDSTRRLACNTFRDFVGADRMLDSIRRRDVLSWRDSLMVSGAKPATVNNKLSFARGIFHHFRDELAGDPFADSQISKADVRREEDARSRFSDSQARRILAEASKADPETCFAVLLAAYAGMRRSEIFALTGDGVDARRKLLRLNGTKTPAARRTVPLHPELLKAGFLDFAKGAGNGKLFRRHANRFGARFSAILANLGIDSVEDPTTGERYRVSFHSFRHCAKSKMTRADIHPETRDRILGHALPGMSDVYDKMVPPEKLAEMREAVRRISYKASKRTRKLHSKMPR